MIRHWLATIRALLDDSEKILRLFFFGAVTFFIGLVLIVSADKWYQPSLQQELVVFIGVVVGAAGFATAILAHILLIIQRLRMNRDPD